MNFNSWIEANTPPPVFDYRVEEHQENGCEGRIIVEAVINQEINRETVGFSYTFTIEEFTGDGPCPLKDDLFLSFTSGGVSTLTTLSYINNEIMIARDVTASPEYGPNNLLRFTYWVHALPNNVIFDENFSTNYDSDDEISEVNVAIHNSTEDMVLNYIPANKSTIDSLTTHIFPGCNSGTFCEDTVCAICLDNYVSGTKIVELDCGHIFDHECIVKWLNTSHYCPLCKYEFQT